MHAKDFYRIVLHGDMSVRHFIRDKETQHRTVWCTVSYMHSNDFYRIVLHSDINGRHLKKDIGTFTISFTENPLI